MISYFGKIYYDFSINLFVNQIKKYTKVSHIILNGSVANGTCKYFRSDIDLTVILKGNESVEEFYHFYHQKLRVLKLVCPYILPVSERIQNVYNEDQLSSSKPLPYRGFLNNTPYKVLYGGELNLSTHKIDDIFFIENKIFHL